MTTYFIFAAGLSISVIGILALVGWLIGAPALTTWGQGQMPMAPATAMLSAAMGASLMLCALRKRANRCLPGLVLSTLSLAASATLLFLRMSGHYLRLEHLGFRISGTAHGAPLGFTSLLAAASFALAAIAFISQFVPGIDRKSRLIAALSAAVAIITTGVGSLLTATLGYPVLAGPAHIPIAVNTAVVLLVLGCGLAAMGIRLSDWSSRRAASSDGSWRRLVLAFAAVFILTVVAGYAFYRQEEVEMQIEVETRLDGIQLIPTIDAGAVGAAQTASGLTVRTKRLPNSAWSLMAVTDGSALSDSLWQRLRWVLAFAAMLLVSVGAILALVWRNHRAEQYWERANLAEALRLQSDRANQLVARSPAVLYTLRASGAEFAPTDISENVERILGYTVAEVDGTWFEAHLFAEDRDAAMAAPAALGTVDELTNEFRFVRKDGAVVWIQNQMTVTRRDAGVPIEVSGAWHDITEQRKAEALVRESEERLRLALAAAKQGLWDFNVQTGEAIVSSEYATMLGYDADDFHETRARWVSRQHPDDREAAETSFRNYLEGRTDTYEVECRQQTRSGEWRWILSRGMLIARSPDGRPLRMLGIHTDIDARKGAELRSEALLKEVHHRVKNNLQVISSLLRLERDRHADATVKSAMDEMQLRILSMALLHEALYRSSDLAHVDLGAYLTDLARQVFRSSAPSTGTISLQLNMASVLVDLDHAIPCGLLVNEILSNCLKHAFPGGRGGIVTIDLEPEGSGPAYILRISDTGVGLPADFETRRAGSLGVHLIKALARQLQARLTIAAGPGASFNIAFSTNGAAPAEETT